MDIEPLTLIWIARLVFIAIALLIALGVWHFMRRERLVYVSVRPDYSPPNHIELPEENIVIAIMAKPGRVFDNLKIFKTMHELNFQFSENNIFEYLSPDSKDVIFSIINGKAPNTFNSDHEKMVPTSAIIAVMQLPIGDGYNQVQHFHLLLSVLDELQTNLDADLCDTHKNLLSTRRLYEMQEKVESFEQSYTALIQNDYQRNHS